MNDQDPDFDAELDDMLHAAGQRWRAQAPSTLSVSEGLFARSSRSTLHRLIPNLLAIAVLAILAVIVLPRVFPSSTGGPVTPTPSTGTPTPEVLEVVSNGQRVTANAFIMEAEGGGLKACDLALAAAEPGAVASCVGPELDIEGADSLRSLINYNANIIGTWQNGRIVVESASIAPIDEVPSRDLPCAAPEGGWPSLGGDVVAVEAAIQRLVDYVAARPSDFAGTWSVPLPGPGVGVFVVTTTLERSAAERDLRAVFAGALCVEPVEFSGAELADVAEQLQDMNSTWDVRIEPQLNRVAVVVAAIDASTAELLEPYLQMIDVRPIVRPL